MPKDERADAQYRRAYSKFIKDTHGWTGPLPLKLRESIKKLSVSTIKQRLQSASKRTRDVSTAKKESKSRTIAQLKKDFIKVARKLKMPEDRIKSKINIDFKHSTKSSIEKTVLAYEAVKKIREKTEKINI